MLFICVWYVYFITILLFIRSILYPPYHQFSTPLTWHHRRQLHLTYERIWDLEQRQLFWFNYATQQASWDRPLLLTRYITYYISTPYRLASVKVIIMTLLCLLYLGLAMSLPLSPGSQ